MLVKMNWMQKKLMEKMYKFFNKVGKHEAHDVLQERINEAIKQKYEWLR